jgi:urease accessory protein
MATSQMITARVAFAHAGHDAGIGFTSGLWSVRQNATPKNSIQLFVIGEMILGAAIAWGGTSLPGAETCISLSVIMADILIATLAKLLNAVGGLLVAAFMVFHGFVHGAEMPAGATLVTYLAGFSVATLALTFTGRGLGALMQGADNRVARALGGVIAATGTLLAAA